MGNKKRPLQRGRRRFEILGRFLRDGEEVLLRGSEFGELDPFHGRFVFLKAWRSAKDGGEDGHWSGRKEGFSFLALGVFYDAALEEAGGGGHDGVAFGSLFLVAHAEVAAGTLEIHHILVFGAGGAFGIVVVEDEAGIPLQDVPVAFGFEFIDNIVSRRGHDERGFELNLAILRFEVAEHLGKDLEISFVDHAGTDKAEVDFLIAAVEGKLADGVVGVSLGDVVVVDVGVGDHGFDNLVEVDNYFGVIVGGGIRSEGRLFAGLDFSNALVGLVDESLEDAAFVVHALVDHDLNAAFGDLKRFDEGFVLRNTDGSLGFHFSSPVREGEGLIGG